MASSMEGNWQLLPLCAQKPLVAKGTTHTYKRTFPLDHATGHVLITGAVSTEEVVLEQNSSQYAGTRLMRGVWEEEGRGGSGTFFPLASPAEGVVWGSAGHCLLTAQRKWRCGYGTDLLLFSPHLRPLHRTVLDMGWLRAGCNPSELAEHIPSQPLQRIADADIMPDFGFMFTEAPEGAKVQQLFIPSARQLAAGDPVCVLGFAHHPEVGWARTFLRTQEDYEAALESSRMLRHSPPSLANWRLDTNTALWRLRDLGKDEVCHPSRLAASPGQVVAASERIIEHTCSTFPGMSGAPGVDIHTPWKLLFVHTRADADFRRNNYGYSVHHPLFVRAYEKEVLPRLLATPPDLLTLEMLRCLHEYLLVHEHQLANRAVLRDLERRC